MATGRGGLHKIVINNRPGAQQLTLVVDNDALASRRWQASGRVWKAAAPANGVEPSTAAPTPVAPASATACKAAMLANFAAVQATMLQSGANILITDAVGNVLMVRATSIAGPGIDDFRFF
jgi:hypothetical protein